MRLLASTVAIAALGLAVGGCAVKRTYVTELDVCSSGNGTVKSATVTKSSGDAELDKYALEKVAKPIVYEASSATTCKPLTVEYEVYGERAAS